MDETKKDIKEEKQKLRDRAIDFINATPIDELKRIHQKIEDNLFDFANFMEAKIVLLYVGYRGCIGVDEVIKKSLAMGKIVALPIFNKTLKTFGIYKIDDFEKDLKKEDDRLVPDKERCKSLPIDSIDISLIPGMAFDEKGGRVGTGKRTYDRLIPKLPNTSRKVSLSYENQIFKSSVPMASYDKYIDIIITEERVIYKI